MPPGEIQVGFHLESPISVHYFLLLFASLIYSYDRSSVQQLRVQTVDCKGSNFSGSTYNGMSSGKLLNHFVYPVLVCKIQMKILSPTLWSYADTKT